MRGLIADLRYGLSELVVAPRAGSRSAVWLLAGIVLGAGLARWSDPPLADGPAAPLASAPAEANRVPASRQLDGETETRLRCLVGHPGCPTAPLPSPCAVEAPRPLDS